MESPANKTVLIGEQMILLLECPSEEKLTLYFITDFGVLLFGLT